MRATTTELIHAAVIESGRPQTEVATAVGLSWPQWQRRMRNDVAWRFHEVQAISRALDVPLEHLTGGQE